MSGFGHIKAARIIVDGAGRLLVGVQIADLEDPDAAGAAFIQLPSREARPIASELLAAADDSDWHADPDQCPQQEGGTTSSAIRTPAPAVPARARALAAQLASLFEEDQQIVVELNDAHDRLAAANDRLCSDPAVDPLTVHEQIRRAFLAYQQASDERRQLAVDVGELSQQLADALAAAGHAPEHARSANVHQLAAGIWRLSEERQG